MSFTCIHERQGNLPASRPGKVSQLPGEARGRAGGGREGCVGARDDKRANSTWNRDDPNEGIIFRPNYTGLVFKSPEFSILSFTESQLFFLAGGGVGVKKRGSGESLAPSRGESLPTTVGSLKHKGIYHSCL